MYRDRDRGTDAARRRRGGHRRRDRRRECPAPSWHFRRSPLARTSAPRARISAPANGFSRQGTTLTPSRLGATAALGLGEVTVYARPRVAILSTGNEIVEPGRPLKPGQIYDVNRFTLASSVSDHGGEPVAYQTVQDTLEDLSSALDACLQEDLLVFSGGSSVGERDLILDLLAARGEVIFHGIAVKPGKPTAFGRVGGKLFFGMPGYPTSCLFNAYILLAPALRRIARLAPQRIALGVLAAQPADQVGAGPASVLYG